MARLLDGAIAGRSQKQLGLITSADLEVLGVTRAQRRRLLAAGTLVPLCGPVLRHAAFPESHEQRALALMLANGPEATIARFTAARAWRFDGLVTGRLQILLPHGARAITPYGTAHRSRDLGPADVTTLGLARITTPARTLIDIAPFVDADGLEQAYDGAVRDGLVRPAFLRWRVEQLRRSGFAGAPDVAALLDRTEGRPVGDSWLEQEALRWIDRCRLPRRAPRARRSGNGSGRYAAKTGTRLGWSSLRRLRDRAPDPAAGQGGKVGVVFA
jgi:hypothetical protein